jgi:hypothetical protein
MGAIAAIFVGFGIIGVIWGVMQKLKAGRLSKAPLVSTGDAAGRGDQVAGPHGAIAVQGAVEARRRLVSPVTGTECLYYELKVVGTWKEGDSTKSKDYVHEKACAELYVNDGTGAVRVDASGGGDFDPCPKTFEETKKEGFLADLKNAMGQGQPIMFGSYAFTNPTLSKADKFTCTERVMPLQSSLYVCGRSLNGTIGAPQIASLILSSKSRDELLGSTARNAKRFLLGGAATAVVGAVLGVVSSLVSG